MESFNEANPQISASISPTTEPKNCYTMVYFNNDASDQDAEDLANFLTNNGYPTFCTMRYYLDHIGIRQKVTMIGASTCRHYIPLITKGWQESDACEFEIIIVMNCYTKKNESGSGILQILRRELWQWKIILLQDFLAGAVERVEEWSRLDGEDFKVVAEELTVTGGCVQDISSVFVSIINVKK